MPSTSTGAGLLLASNAADRQGQGEAKGGSSMFNVFPKMLIAIIVYALVAFGTAIPAENGLDAFAGNMTAFQNGECAGMENAGPDAVECRQGVLNRALGSIDMAGEGEWVLTTSDLLITLGLFMLFFEMLKAPSSGNATVFNNLFSTLVLIVAILLFVLQPLFATSTFFIIMLMCLVDTAAGWFITTIASRRDLAVGGEG